jgi:hypothetical protein
MIFDPSIKGLGYAPDDDDFDQDAYDDYIDDLIHKDR